MKQKILNAIVVILFVGICGTTIYGLTTKNEPAFEPLTMANDGIDENYRNVYDDVTQILVDHYYGDI